MTVFLREIAKDWEITLPWVVILISMISLDILFGVAVALIQNKLCSTVSRVGMARKILMLATVLVAALFDGLLPSLSRVMAFEVFGLRLEFQIHVTIAIVLVAWWTVTEFVSITEKGGKLRMPMPQKVRKAFVKLQDAVDGAVAAKVEGIVKITPADADENK